MEEMLDKFMLSLKAMVSLKKIVRTISLKIQTIFHALPFKSVRTALTPKVKNPGIKETAGPHLVTQSGKSPSMD